MSNVFFISDLHFGHERIIEFGKNTGVQFRSGDCWRENMHIIIDNWNRVVGKRDLVYVLGDVAFNQEGFDALSELNGRKILVRGNHDNLFTTEQLLEHFESVEGLVKYKKFWLSHSPIHPDELRGKRNCHGHVHNKSIKNSYTGEYDERYINVCCEAIGETPIDLNSIKSGSYYKTRLC